MGLAVEALAQEVRVIHLAHHHLKATMVEMDQPATQAVEAEVLRLLDRHLQVMTKAVMAAMELHLLFLAHQLPTLVVVEVMSVLELQLREAPVVVEMVVV